MSRYRLGFWSWVEFRHTLSSDFSATNPKTRYAVSDFIRSLAARIKFARLAARFPLGWSHYVTLLR